jgi:uncharacterized protein YqjF (DUF2071 family)
MKTVFRHCFLANFAVDSQVMRRAVPEPIELQLHDGRAYLSIVIARMERMRPAFLPAFTGVTYNQVVYRVVVRYQGEPGVYFVRSDADSRLMSLAGDWLTFFRFHYSPMSFARKENGVQFDLAAAPIQHADIHALYALGAASGEMPNTSTFPTLAQAQDFLVELFAAFGYSARSRKVDTVRIKRGLWNIQVVPDLLAQYDFMKGSHLFPEGSAQLDSVFYVRDLPYYWHTLNRKA